MILFGMPDQLVIVPTIALVKDGGYLRLTLATLPSAFPSGFSCVNKKDYICKKSMSYGNR